MRRRLIEEYIGRSNYRGNDAGFWISEPKRYEIGLKFSSSAVPVYRYATSDNLVWIHRYFCWVP